MEARSASIFLSLLPETEPKPKELESEKREKGAERVWESPERELVPNLLGDLKDEDPASEDLDDDDTDDEDLDTEDLEVDDYDAEWERESSKKELVTKLLWDKKDEGPEATDKDLDSEDLDNDETDTGGGQAWKRKVSEFRELSESDSSSWAEPKSLKGSATQSPLREAPKTSFLIFVSL